MRSLYVAISLFALIGTASAQVPSGAPAGTTGVCKDGTYSDAASKRGACAGHKGVKEWFAKDAVAPSPASTATPAAAPAAVPATVAKTPSVPTVAAAGGGNGQVWVNSASKVYHCPGDRYYGKTKAGAYMTEQAAIAAGNHGERGKTCKPA